MTRRSRLERYRDILRVVANFGPIRQTHIMYKANLTWEGLKEDLSRLKGTQLVAETIREEGVFYMVTQAGRDVLTHFGRIEETLQIQVAPSIVSRYSSLDNQSLF